MLVNERFFDFALCVMCYLSITLELSYVLFLYPSTFAQLLFHFIFHLFLLLDPTCGPCFCFSSHFAI
jgi:hypothetical protein